MAEDEHKSASEQFFATVGQYIITFQFLEAKIEECLLLWWGHENWQASRMKLASMTNKKKVDALWSEFRGNVANERGRERPEWIDRFEEIVTRMHLERRRRNKLVHSHYLFDFAHDGGPVLQVDPKEGLFPFTDEAQQSILKEISQLATDMGRAHLQAVHDHLDPPAPG